MLYGSGNHQEIHGNGCGDQNGPLKSFFRRVLWSISTPRFPLKIDSQNANFRRSTAPDWSTKSVLKYQFCWSVGPRMIIRVAGSVGVTPRRTQSDYKNNWRVLGEFIWNAVFGLENHQIDHGNITKNHTFCEMNLPNWSWVLGRHQGQPEEHGRGLRNGFWGI